MAFATGVVAMKVFAGIVCGVLHDQVTARTHRISIRYPSRAGTRK
jgi:hypothetical protein